MPGPRASPFAACPVMLSSTQYGTVFSCVAAVLGAYAVRFGGWHWLLFWPALSFALVALAYFAAGPVVFGKRPNGSISLVSLAALFPFLAYTWFLWHAARLLRRENPFDELLPDVLIGRRLLDSEFPPGIDVVVDLTSELPEPRCARSAQDYICFPLLDGSSGNPASLIALVRRLASIDGRILVHCAQGHGRTGLLATTYILATSHQSDAGEAIRYVRSRRPGVRLTREQRNAVHQVAGMLDSQACAPT
jgi:protein-tyrosine phosphatase